MFRLTLLLTLAGALLLVGCTVTPVKPLDVASVRRVGWYVEFDPRVHNVHTGLTVFGNFDQALDNDWAVNQYLEQSLDSRLRAAGYESKRVELDAESARLLREGGCFSNWDGHYRVEVCGERFAKLMRAQGVDALISSIGYSAPDYFTQGPAQLPHVGVFTRGSDRPNLLVPYAHVSMQIFAGNPAEPRTAGECMAGRSRDPSPWSKDVAQMSIVDLAWLRPELEKLLDRSAEVALTTSGLVKGTAPPCPNQTPSFDKL